MATTVLIPQKRDKVEKGSDNFGTVMPMVLGAVGNAIAPGAGGAVGGAAGSYLAREMATPDKVIHAQNTHAVEEPESAFSRRRAQLEQDPYMAIAQANRALERAPKEIQDTYRKPLEEAMAIAEKSRQSAASAARGGV